MQQSVQVNQPPQQVLNDAAAFVSKRRAKVTDRSERGFRFGLEGAGAEDSGRLTIAPGRGGVSTVTVEANGLGVLAIAEGVLRELRKQARSQPRGSERPGGGFADLRQRLGMPPVEPPRPNRPPRPPRIEAVPAVDDDAEPVTEGAAAAAAAATPEAGPASAPPQAGPASAPPQAGAGGASTSSAASGEVERAARAPMPADQTGATASSATETRASAGPERPDGPAPTEAPYVRADTGPQSTPAPADAPVRAPHPAHVGPDAEAPDRAPAHENLVNAQPSAEQIGGVPAPGTASVKTALAGNTTSPTAAVQSGAGSPQSAPTADPSREQRGGSASGAAEVSAVTDATTATSLSASERSDLEVAKGTAAGTGSDAPVDGGGGTNRTA